MDALHAHVVVRERTRSHHRAGRGHLHLRRPGAAIPGRTGGTLRRAGRTRPHRTGRGGLQAGAGPGLLPHLVVRPPEGGRTRRAAGPRGTGRPEQGLLHHRRRRGGRDRVEAGEAVLQADRQADQAQGHLPRRRLPRHAAGGALHHRTARPQGPVRAAGAGRAQGTEHQHLPRAALRRRPRGVRPLGRRPDRAADPLRGPGDRRRRLPGAGAERRRLLPAAARLLPARPRDLRPVRRAARLRRGHLRLRPARNHLRVRQVRLLSRT